MKKAIHVKAWLSAKWGRMSVLLFVFGIPMLAESADPMKVYGDQIIPILERACFSCHGEEKQKGDLNFATLTEYTQVLENRELWQQVLERVQADEMPPEGARKMNYGERQSLMKWLRELPQPKTPDCDQLASDRTQNYYRGHVMSRRLTRHEYDNTIRDLIGLDLKPGRLLPSDGSGGEGFDNNGDTLFSSTLAIEQFLAAAQQVVDVLFPEHGHSPSEEVAAAQKQILVSLPSAELNATQAARNVLTRFASRAYRRPATDDETNRLLTLFERRRSRGEDFVNALKLPLQAVLVSPHFLFLAEPEPESRPHGVQPLGAFPLATRLSYFLWASMPDEELLQLARSGELLDPDIYAVQIRRMLGDPKAKALGERFALQWLELERLGTEVHPDRDRFPEYSDSLAEAMRHEAVAWFNCIIEEDRSLLELIDSRETIINGSLARLYGIEGVEGDAFRKVALEDPARGGLVGMAAVHASTSYPLRTSPVLRGKWILEVLLGERIPPPPPNVPALEVDEETITAATLREQLEIHRRDPECAACHNRMDPLGFGLESFDVLGRFRAEADATGTLPSGRQFSGPAELKQILMERRHQVMRQLVRKLAGYALGRKLNRFDECVIRDGMLALEGYDYSPSALIESIATSFPFRHRFYANPEPHPPES